MSSDQRKLGHLPWREKKLTVQNDALKEVVKLLLETYWGTGDGDEPPEFIKEAAELSGWKFPEASK